MLIKTDYYKVVKISKELRPSGERLIYYVYFKDYVNGILKKVV